MYVPWLLVSNLCKYVEFWKLCNASPSLALVEHSSLDGSHSTHLDPCQPTSRLEGPGGRRCRPKNKLDLEAPPSTTPPPLSHPPLTHLNRAFPPLLLLYSFSSFFYFTTMYCIECGHLLPSHRTPSTICSKCKTPLATWWDESSQTYRTNRESILPDTMNPYATHSHLHNGSGSGSGLGSPQTGIGGGLGVGGLGGGYGVSIGEIERMRSRRNEQTEEERNFNGALVTLELHFERPGNYLMKAMVEVKKMVARTLDLSLNKAEVR